MRYKALILDLDGTTIYSKREAVPSKRVIEAVRKIQKHMVVTIATGRTLRDALPSIELLNLTHSCILLSGIQLYEPLTKKIVHEHDMDQRLVPELLHVVEQHASNIHVFDGVESILWDHHTIPSRVLSIFVPVIVPDQSIIIESLFKKYSLISTHRMPSWEKEGMECLEICDRYATKYHRIVEFCTRMGITKHECVGIGDGLNDIALMQACGLKVAMGNAHPELKVIADIIAPTVDDDGVADIIERYLFSQ